MLLELTPKQVNALKMLKGVRYNREEMDNNSWGDCSVHYRHTLYMLVCNEDRAKESIETFNGIAEVAGKTTMPDYNI